MAVNLPDDWRELAEAVRQEQNSDRLIQLVDKLNRVLEDQATRLRKSHITEESVPPGFPESSAVTAYRSVLVR